MRFVPKNSAAYNDKNTVHSWAVYDHPSDYPDFFIAREHVGVGAESYPTDNVMLFTEIAPLRYCMRMMGLVRLERHTYDDPRIVESWV